MSVKSDGCGQGDFPNAFGERSRSLTLGGLVMFGPAKLLWPNSGPRLCYQILLCGLVWFSLGLAAMGQILAHANCVYEIPVHGAITAATLDFIERGERQAEMKGCEALLLEINTPGGSLETTRRIVERILASPRPVLCLVAPQGGHAGSAGALILQACHVAGAVRATNLGAATPILGSGQALSDDLRKKMVEDTRSFSAGLAKLRGRSVEFAEKIVTEAQSLDAEAALRAGGLDLVVAGREEFLHRAEGRSVTMPGEEKLVLKNLAVLPVERLQQDLREKVLSLFADPELAYLLFLAALGLLYFEITHPGATVPGVAGAVLLIISLVAFHKLDVVWGGVGLIGLGVGFLIAEAFIPSFGALGVGGIVAIGIGSVFLFDPASGGLQLSPWLSLGVPAVFGITLLAFGYFVFAPIRRRGASLAEDDFGGATASIDEVKVGGGMASRQGSVTIRGEIWQVECDEVLSVGESVKVVGREGLKLKVKKA
jgi:membrane-bound serine protease (ClpP class)